MKTDTKQLPRSAKSYIVYFIFYKFPSEIWKQIQNSCSAQIRKFFHCLFLFVFILSIQISIRNLKNRYKTAAQIRKLFHCLFVFLFIFDSKFQSENWKQIPNSRPDQPTLALYFCFCLQISIANLKTDTKQLPRSKKSSIVCFCISFLQISIGNDKQLPRSANSSMMFLIYFLYFFHKIESEI